ncbi:5'/3'-nucleotidase SurE [Halalkalirubrum salinum]|uniref:5'/3'-nucleotidase SurE n=1 Tax=Halalkalirubrum salinum TaxID=2563889 RepID=UPI0010FB5C52|nr:5'/3'-nucleotidase SurE [Halalkalirubrum salinum]
MDDPRILLTNDDGIDSVGFAATYDALSAVGDVVAVAPLDDQSAVGRSMSHEVRVHDHRLGYAVEGTPADCVVAGLSTLTPDVDIVVSGCNKGANLGSYVLGRSGTVSAAVEAAYFGVPAIAVSLYIPSDQDWESGAIEPEEYRNATDAAAYFVRQSASRGVFEQVDYLNINAPLYDGESAPIAVTEPSGFYDMGAERDGDVISIEDHIWGRMRNGNLPDPEGTDRRAVYNGTVSVSPLTAPHTASHHDALDELVAAYHA